MDEGAVRALRLLDVTLRDGGYVNGHAYASGAALAIGAATSGAGVEYVEAGYFRPRRPDLMDRPVACCPSDYLDLMRAALAPGSRLAVMAHTCDFVVDDARSLAAADVALVRLPARPDRVADLAPYVDALHDAGVAASVNLIRVSELDTSTVVAAAACAEAIGADMFYIADSNGALFPGRTADLVRALRANVGLPLGFHAHDGLEMAFANSLAAISQGATMIDGSLGGMGKGGGNLVLELIAAYLRVYDGAGYRPVALAEAAATHLAPWLGERISARHEFLASSLLNLNLDDIARLASNGPLVALLEMPPLQPVPATPPVAAVAAAQGV